MRFNNLKSYLVPQISTNQILTESALYWGLRLSVFLMLRSSFCLMFHLTDQPKSHQIEMQRGPLQLFSQIKTLLFTIEKMKRSFMSTAYEKMIKCHRKNSNGFDHKSEAMSVKKLRVLVMQMRQPFLRSTRNFLKYNYLQWHLQNNAIEGQETVVMQEKKLCGFIP